jgi:hypothetical protein
MRRRLTAMAALVLVLGALTAPLARADGDPASDWLYTQWVFFPFDVQLDAGLKHGLQTTVDDAKQRGYRIKVALIAQPSDLGSVPQLFAKPEQYARFLGLELRFLYHGRLLIVMPNGFGVSRDGKVAPHERRALRGVPLGRGDDALVEGAIRAVRRLAASAGIKLPPVPTSSPSSSSGTDRLVIAYAAIGAGLVIGAAWLGRHRRRTGHWL